MGKNHSPARYVEEKRKSLLLKNVYYQFLTTNINLFLNAYINRDYDQLHKSFYSVSVAITTMDMIKTHVYPFIFYFLDRLSLTWNCSCFFKANWHKYKEEKRNKMRREWARKEVIKNLDRDFSDGDMV